MFMKLIESGDLSAGMQKRIERSLAGEKLPGYYPLGEAPAPDLVVHRPGGRGGLANHPVGWCVTSVTTLSLKVRTT